MTDPKRISVGSRSRCSVCGSESLGGNDFQSCKHDPKINQLVCQD